MDVLVLNHDYGQFLEWLYDENPELANATYEKQVEARRKSLFGISYFYPDNLSRYGYETTGIYLNNEHMQRAWRREFLREEPGGESKGGRNGETTVLHKLRELASGTPLRRLEPTVKSYLGYEYTRPPWFYDTLREQIEYYQPDIVLNQAVNIVSTDFLSEVDKHFGTLVGQIQSPLSDDIELSVYDGLVSALPSLVDRFKAAGVPGLKLPLAFEETILERVDLPEETDIPAVFVGSLSEHHESRIEWLDEVCASVPVEVYAPSVDSVPTNSPIHDYYQGSIWGREMYRTLARSKVVLNNHIDMAGPYAANLRLYESTGVGSCLLTDHKKNLPTLFNPGEEVLTYKDPNDCVRQLRSILNDEDRCRAIAMAGQKRTLNDHTYYDRMGTLTSFLECVS